MKLEVDAGSIFSFPEFSSVFPNLTILRLYSDQSWAQFPSSFDYSPVRWSCDQLINAHDFIFQNANFTEECLFFKF